MGHDYQLVSAHGQDAPNNSLNEYRYCARCGTLRNDYRHNGGQTSSNFPMFCILGSKGWEADEPECRPCGEVRGPHSARELLIFLIAGILIGVLFALLAYRADGAPDRPAPKVPDVIPNVGGLSNWGFVEQNGRKLKIVGHPLWEGTGEIREDGTVILHWRVIYDDFGLADGVGIYLIDGRNLIGRWGHVERAWIDYDGQLAGETELDRLEK